MGKIAITALLLAAAAASALVFAGAAAAPPTTTPAKSRKAENDPSATLITLHCDNAPAKDVLHELFDQLGFDFETSPASTDAWPALTIDADHQPFWQVARQINTTLHTTIRLRQNGKLMVIRSSNTISSPESGMPLVSGACMLVAHEARHNLVLTATDKPVDCGILTLLLIEPHLRVAGIPDRVTPDVAIDENGHSLLDGKTFPTVLNAPEFDRYSEVLIALAPPENAGRTIARLKGTVHLSVVDQTRVIEIPVDEFAEKHMEELGGAAWTISAAPTQTAQGTEYRLSSSLVRGQLSDDEWARATAILNGVDIQILDEKGAPYVASLLVRGTSSTNRTTARIFRPEETAGRGPSKAGPAEKMRIVIPTVIKDVPVPFEFKDLPLP